MTAVVDPTREGASLGAALEPVRRALDTDAASEAAAIVESARARANDRIAAAEVEADRQVADARRRAEASGRARAARELDRARERARRSELACRRELRDDLEAAVAAAVLGLRSDPRYQELLDHLAEVAAGQLGRAATIVRDPEPDGGVLATAGARRVDYRLPAVARRLVDLVDLVVESDGAR